jgi:hypothetical protein
MGEPFRLFSFRWPARLRAIVRSDGTGSVVDYDVSNFGFGPMQSAHVRKVLGNVTAELASLETPPR